VLDGDVQIELAKQAQEGDEQAREMLINHNLRLVVKVAQGYYRQSQGNGLPLLDLIQEGTFGLVRAIDKFDASKGYQFSTYAMWWVRQAVRKGLADKSRTVKVPSHIIDLAYRAAKLTAKLSSQWGREPTDEELAEALNITPAKLTEVRIAAMIPSSLDRPYEGSGASEDATEDLVAFLIDPTELSTHELATIEVDREILHKALSKLTWREQKIIELRFGLGEKEPMHLVEVGNYFGLSYQRIRQIETSVLTKLQQDSTLNILRST
jgi:RNA polymerase primary sigma factor